MSPGATPFRMMREYIKTKNVMLADAITDV